MSHFASRCKLDYSFYYVVSIKVGPRLRIIHFLRNNNNDHDDGDGVDDGDNNDKLLGTESEAYLSYTHEWILIM